MTTNYACGVYRILNNKTGKVYIGSSKNLKARLNTHKNQLNSGRHINSLLQEDWNKYGSTSFTIEPIEYMSVGEEQRLFEIERYWLGKFSDNYNLAVIPYVKDIGRETIFVTIVKCSLETFWYKDKIGEKYLVFEECEGDWYKLVGKNKGIVKSDAKPYRHNEGKAE